MEKNESSLPKVYRADEVAELLQVCTKTVLNLVRAGRLERLPHLRGVRITQDSLQRFLVSRSQKAQHG